MSEVDAVVIGAGPAGEVCAGRLAGNGLEVTLVERELVGGECSYYACMPSKALLRPGDLVDEVHRVPGVQLDTPPLDVPRVLARRDEVIHDRDDSAQLPWLESRGVTLLRGHARLEGERRVRVGEELLEARRAVVVATGSSAVMPPIPGLAEAAPWTNREVTTASAIPGRLLVLGGGVVGVEMAQAYAALGASVAIVEALPRLIAREEEFASMEVEDGLRAAGVEVHLGAKATAVSRGEKQVRLELETGEALAGRRAARGDRAPRQHDRHGPRGLRGRARQADRGRRPDARRRLGLAVCHRRRQRPRPAHPCRQVPGPRGGGGHPRPRRPRHLRTGR